METARLQLIPFAPIDILALLAGAAPFEARIGLRVDLGLYDFYQSEEISPGWIAHLRASSGEPADPWQWGFAIAHRDSQTIIGGAGYKGPPDEDGMVEIAYGIVPSYQNQGYATEAADALLDFAFDSGHVRLVRAHTLAENNASMRVLEKCGFRCTGEVMDPEDGLVRRWERARQPGG